jgi:hypothetical protein
MSAEVLKYSREQIETMEVAPGFKHENLEGWIPEFASDHDAHEALEKAFDYRGDVTLTLKSGERIEAYIFNRSTGATLAESWVQYFTPKAPEKRKVSYAEIARLEFTRGRQALGRLGAEVQRAQGRRRKGNRAGSGSAGLSRTRQVLRICAWPYEGIWQDGLKKCLQCQGDEARGPRF